MIYLLDSNVFIEAMNRYYRPDICPGFWDWLSTQAVSVEVYSISAVYDEIRDYDELKGWLRDNREIFIPQDDLVTVENYSSVVNHVESTPRFSRQERDKFLGKADPWLIAKAISINATIVTHEVSAPLGRKVKVPDVCGHFNVPVTDTFDLLELLGVRFVLEK